MGFPFLSVTNEGSVVQFVVVALIVFGYTLSCMVGFLVGQRSTKDLVMLCNEEVRDIVVEALIEDKRAYIKASIDNGSYGSKEYYETLRRKSELIAMALR